jgi:tape measure domain-containing protein
MAETAEQLVVSLEARIRDFERNFQRASRASNDNWRIIEARASQGAQKLDTTFAQATRNVSNHFKLMATSAAGALSAALGVSELRKFADEWTAARSKIAAAGEEMENVGKRQSDLTDMANRSRSSIGAVVDLYTGLTRSTKEMGASQAQVLRVTENISKAFATSGASIEEAKGAITQLNQALASGALRGDELNSVMEQAPTLARLIAKEFGVTIGELKKLGEDGKLSADRVFKAILNGTAQIEEEFAKTTPTIAQSWQILTNSLTRYVGETDQAVGASKAISGALKGMADNIDIVAPAAATLAAGLAAAFAGGPIVGGITAATVALVGFSDKIHPIPSELASLADYAGVAWTLIKDKGGEAANYLQQQFAAAADHISAALQSVNGSGMGDLLAAVKTLANGIIAAFDIAASTIKISFTSIGPIVAETMTNAVNHTIADIEAMANKVIEAVNRIAKAFGQVGQISKIELGRVGNSFAGSSEQAGKAIGKAIREAIGKDYIGDIGHGLQDLRDRANEATRKRQEAARPKPHDDGSLDQQLTPGKDPEEAKKAEAAKKAAEAKAQKQIEDYDKIVAKAREFIETQEIERQAMSMDVEAASALRHEHEMLNQAKEHGIELTDKQKAQIHDLANQMATAETATKNFQDMQASLKEFGDTISGELTSALEGLVTGSTKLEDVWKRLALLFAKMALEAVLLGKGPLAGLFGVQGGGLLGGTAFGGSLGDAFAKLWGVQSTSLAPQLSDATRAVSATPSAPASATTPTAVSAITPKITEAIEQGAQTAAEKATANVPTPPSRPSDLTPSAPLPPHRPGDLTPNIPTPPRRPADLASDGLPAPVPPANIPHVGKQIGLTPKEVVDLKKTLMTEWVPGQGDMQGKGIIDTILNRKASGHWGNSVTDVVNAKKQFSAINGGQPWANGRVAHSVDDIPDSVLQGGKGKLSSDLADRWLAERAGGAKSVVGDHLNYANRAASTPNNWAWIDKLNGPKFGAHKHGTTADLERFRPGEFGVNLPGQKPKQQVDMTPTGSIAKRTQEAAKQAQEATSRAAEQASQAQQRLSEQLTRSSQSVQQVTQPLQGMDAGVGQLAGSLSQGIPATQGFAGELQKLIEQLLSGLGGGGGGLGGIGDALGGILGFADGGPVSGPGGPTSDSIPAFLSDGEYVVNAKAAGKHARLLEAINSGRAPRFAVGGFVGGDSFASAMTYAPSTSINIAGSGNARQDATLAQQAGDAVSAALAKHFRPDTFRRNDQQRMAAAFRAMNKAHIRNG